MFRVLVLTLLVSAGCGPVQYVTIVTFQAQKAVNTARHAQAEQLAPYEYTLAVENLHKARELAGHARWQDAIRFGKDALEQGNKAATLSEEKRGKPEEKDDVPLRDPPGESQVPQRDPPGGSHGPTRDKQGGSL